MKPSQYNPAELRAIILALTLQGKRTSELAAFFDCTSEAMLYHMKKLGLKSRKDILAEALALKKQELRARLYGRNPLGLSDAELQLTLVAMVESGLLRKQMAHDLKCKGAKVYYHLRRFNLCEERVNRNVQKKETKSFTYQRGHDGTITRQFEALCAVSQEG